MEAVTLRLEAISLEAIASRLEGSLIFQARRAQVELIGAFSAPDLRPAACSLPWPTLGRGNRAV